MEHVGAGFVVTRRGVIRRYEFGYALQKIVCGTRKEANEQARLLAEREDELASGDVNRWEFGQMPFKQVRRMGFRVQRTHVFVGALRPPPRTSTMRRP